MKSDTIDSQQCVKIVWKIAVFKYCSSPKIERLKQFVGRPMGARSVWNNSFAGQWGEGGGAGLGETIRNIHPKIGFARWCRTIFSVGPCMPPTLCTLTPPTVGPSMARPVHLDPTHLPEYKCWGPTIWDVSQPIWFKICFLQSVIVHLIIMPKKQSWPPVISKREQERREKFRQRLSRDLDNTSLRVQRAEKEKKIIKFRKPHWPPVISSEERERRRFGERLERKSSLQATPSTSQQWPPVLKGVKVSGEIF